MATGTPRRAAKLLNGRSMGKIIMAQPSPLSAPCAANEVALRPSSAQGESFLIVNGSDLRKASVAMMGVRSWRSTGLPLVRASHGPGATPNEGRRFKTTSNEGRRSCSAETRCLKMTHQM